MADAQITFTLGNLYTAILGLCAIITAVAGVAVLINNVIKKMKAPDENRDEKLAEMKRELSAMRDRLDRHDALFEKDRDRFEVIEEGNKVTHFALLALMSHALNGNSIEDLEKARTDLQQYLIERR